MYQKNKVSPIIEKLKCLPIESYVHELALLIDICFLCKNQQSEVAEKIFTLDSLDELANTLEIDYHHSYYDISSEKVTREIITLGVLILAARMNYGIKRLLMALPICKLNTTTDEGL